MLGPVPEFNIVDLKQVATEHVFLTFYILLKFIHPFKQLKIFTLCSDTEFSECNESESKKLPLLSFTKM